MGLPVHSVVDLIMIPSTRRHTINFDTSMIPSRTHYVY